jgi:hypothetical protein
MPQLRSGPVQSLACLHLLPRLLCQLQHQLPSCCCCPGLWLCGHAPVGSWLQRAHCGGCLGLLWSLLLQLKRLLSGAACAALLLASGAGPAAQPNSRHPQTFV